ncbi:unnamed protein product, partial [Cochlearia groenlandica]
VEESKMIDNIVVDVSQKLNVTPSNYFDEMVGMEAHMENVNICLRLECNEVMMIGIQGPAGIEDLEQLDALAKEKTWFGPGKRLVELHMPMSNLERLWGGVQ